MADDRMNGPGTEDAPAVAAPSLPSTRWGRVGVVAAALTLVIGAVLAVVGGVEASRADSDLEEARAELPAFRQDRDQAVEASREAEGRLDEAQERADDVVARAVRAVDISGQLCDCDQAISDELERLSAAITANDPAGADAAVTAILAEIDGSNRALAELRAVAGGGGVAVPAQG